MKRRIVLVVTALVLVALLVGTSIAMADKPPKPPHSGEGNQLTPRPNGFPAGPHYNLNIHGKKVGFACNDTPGGGSVFVPEYGPATIEYVSNRKGSLTELMVLDPCAGFDGDPAKVQLPYEAEGYYVFGRILGKPDHGKNCTDPTCPSKVILYPNVVTQACNDTPVDPNFGNYTSCDEALLALGFILSQDVYVAGNETYIRFDPGVTKGKGKSKATEITRLFTYVGWVVHEDLDIWGAGNTSDGVIDDYDVPGGIYGAPGNATAEILAAGKIVADYDCGYWGNCNGEIDLIEEWLAFQADIDPPMAWYFSEGDSMWIFNIADLVVTEQGLVNDGTKLLQIRFYPKDGTTFEE